MATRCRRFVRALAFVLPLLLAASRVCAYSVLTHEAIIDSSWDHGIAPAIEAKFPGLTAAQLSAARAYAYGGCIIQDMGYYPFGNKLFTDLAHYVRSGDFVMALLADARDANGYAFALGALAHYAADTDGHELGINRAEPLIYPDVRRKYGAVVTYEEDPAAHLKTEFGFDVLEVARNLYPTQAFHDFVGFEVDKPLLEQAFFETYGVKLSDLFLSEDLAIGSYRRTVSTLLPEMTKVAWENNKDAIERARPGITRQQFVYNLSKADYAREWGSQYRRPGPFARVLAALFKVVPKVGPFRALRFRVPPPAADTAFMRSFNATVRQYQQLLAQARAGRLSLANRDFDTGRPTSPGEYRLADRAYARLLDRLARDHFASVSPSLRRNLLAFYGASQADNTTRECRRMWKRAMKDLAELKKQSVASSQ